MVFLKVRNVSNTYYRALCRKRKGRTGERRAETECNNRVFHNKRRLATCNKTIVANKGSSMYQYVEIWIFWH